MLIYSKIPEHMRESVKDYIENGVPLGDFLQKIFENDFMGAAGKADHLNKKHLYAYAMLLYNAPMGCWGSKERVDAWVKVGGLNGSEAM